MTASPPPGRTPFAHVAVVTMPAGDLGAPGAAITVALCGHWEHEPPCPLAPHHTAAERAGDEVRLRTLFVVEPAREAEVRRRIGAALGAGSLVGPHGREARWDLRSSRAASVRPDETDHARRLADS
jgi:hypothetical protein